MCTKAFLLFLLMLPDFSFKQSQLKYERVRQAYNEKEITVKKYFNDKNLEYQGLNIFIRAFKQERVLEVWAKVQGRATYTLLTEYQFCSSSGLLGPKRKEGDLQIPEGFYYINHFNPLSKFHLSLGINYPNASDRILADQNAPGSAIYIHGDCVTVGCIPISDDKIKELYILAVEARNNGQANIPVHIFPRRLTDVAMNSLTMEYQGQPKLISFWKNLQHVYKRFEETSSLPELKVKNNGEYYW